MERAESYTWAFAKKWYEQTPDRNMQTKQQMHN